jgi:hypothetical protein
MAPGIAARDGGAPGGAERRRARGAVGAHRRALAGRFAACRGGRLLLADQARAGRPRHCSRWAALGRRPAALPVVVAEDAPLAFREWTPETPLAADRYGIPTPTAGALADARPDPAAAQRFRWRRLSARLRRRLFRPHAGGALPAPAGGWRRLRDQSLDSIRPRKRTTSGWTGSSPKPAPSGRPPELHGRRSASNSVARGRRNRLAQIVKPGAAPPVRGCSRVAARRSARRWPAPAMNACAGLAPCAGNIQSPAGGPTTGRPRRPRERARLSE